MFVNGCLGSYRCVCIYGPGEQPKRDEGPIFVHFGLGRVLWLWVGGSFGTCAATGSEAASW